MTWPALGLSGNSCRPLDSDHRIRRSRVGAGFSSGGDGADALMEKMRDEVVVGPLRPAAWPRERETAWETKLRSAAETDEGRAELKKAGEQFRLAGIPLDGVFSSRYCRAIESGSFEDVRAVGSLRVLRRVAPGI